MGRKDPRLDARIAKSPEFAKPILNHLRKLAHKGCPEAEETLKWGMPHFTYRGSILFGMGSFKAHVAMGFWLGHLIIGDSKADEKAMGQFGRITSLKDLPSDKVFTGYVKKAMKLINAGAKSPTRAAVTKSTKPPLKAPVWLSAALRRDGKAQAGWKALTPGKQREYIEWLLEAKTEATREKRLAQTLEQAADGKSLNWKYQKK